MPAIVIAYKQMLADFFEKRKLVTDGWRVKSSYIILKC